jgi:hypothetical protein
MLHVHGTKVAGAGQQCARDLAQLHVAGLQKELRGSHAKIMSVRRYNGSRTLCITKPGQRMYADAMAASPMACRDPPGMGSTRCSHTDRCRLRPACSSTWSHWCGLRTAGTRWDTRHRGRRARQADTVQEYARE